jgi:hypothetical protein
MVVYMKNKDLRRKEILRDALKERLHAREIQAAQQGINADPVVAIEIEDIKKKLANLELEITRILSSSINSRKINSPQIDKLVSNTYSVQRVFSSPFHYMAAGIKIALIHHDFFEILKTMIDPIEKEQIIEIRWEESTDYKKDMIGPCIVRNPLNNRSVIIYLTSTKPEYSTSLRRDSISLSYQDRTYLSVDVGATPIEITLSPSSSLRKIHLIPAPQNYRSWFGGGGGGGGEEEEEEEEEE